MDCILKVINGPDKGLEHPLQPGANVVGRGSRAALKLTPEDVSWEHAVITREGDDYYIENLSALGTWVGDARVSGRVRLRPRDKVRLTGESVIRLEPADGGGLLKDRRFLGTLLVVMIGLSVAALFYLGDAQSKDDDWPGAFVAIDGWLQQQVHRGKVGPEARDLLRTGWRLQQANDYDHARATWMRLQIVLDNAERSLHCMELAEKSANDAALQKLLTPQPGQTPKDEDKAAALAQFTRRWLAFSTKKLKESSGFGSK